MLHCHCVRALLADRKLGDKIFKGEIDQNSHLTVICHLVQSSGDSISLIICSPSIIDRVARHEAAHHGKKQSVDILQQVGLSFSLLFRSCDL